MTTIAASVHEGVMVADSRCQIDGTWWPSNKITRVGEMLIGCAGDTLEGGKFLAWMKGDVKVKPKIGENFQALVLSPKGLFYWCNDLRPERVDRGFHAVGSGTNAALGALLAGADCQRAVAIACQIDTNSGGDINVQELRETPHL